MQISSGLLRGIPLRSPKGSQTRPTTERLRQATFNVLRHFSDKQLIDQTRVADLFAGTGAWGIEAMSNGAAQVWFVESHPLAIKTLEENLRAVSHHFDAQKAALPAMHVFKRDILSCYAKLPELDLIFCDPPYDAGWFEKVLQLETQHQRLSVGGLFVYECRKRETIGEIPADLKLWETKIYGDSAVHYFVKQPHAQTGDLPRKL